MDDSWMTQYFFAPPQAPASYFVTKAFSTT
jgi:hypothetical protein